MAAGGQDAGGAATSTAVKASCPKMRRAGTGRGIWGGKGAKKSRRVGFSAAQVEVAGMATQPCFDVNASLCSDASVGSPKRTLHLLRGETENWFSRRIGFFDWKKAKSYPHQQATHVAGLSHLRMCPLRSA